MINKYYSIEVRDYLIEVYSAYKGLYVRVSKINIGAVHKYSTIENLEKFLSDNEKHFKDLKKQKDKIIKFLKEVE